MNWRRIAFCVGIATTGCDRGAQPFRLVDVVPPPFGAPLRVNESITLRFDRAIDPSSVHAESIVLVDETGRAARGRWRVTGERATFIAVPPSAADFSDGGFVPNRRVTLELRGFPGRDGVLATGGDPLATSSRLEFRVVALAPDDPGHSACVDPMPGEAPRLVNGDALRDARGVAQDGVVCLSFSEALAPRDVVAAAFELRFRNEARDRVPCVVELRQDGTRCDVFVRPEAGFRVDTRYLLGFASEHRLHDLAGQPLDDLPTIEIAVVAGGVKVLGASGAGSP